MVLGITKPTDVPGSSAPAIIIGVFVAFGGILFGYDTGTIGGILAMDYFKDNFATQRNAEGLWDFTSSQTSLIVSMLSLGTFFGALTVGPLADITGRRMGLIYACIIFTGGVVMQTASTAIPLFVAGRVIAGYGVGLVSALVPLYQSESAPKWIRGAIVSVYQLAITIGLLLAAVVNKGTGERYDSGSYRIPVAIQIAWAIILVAGLLILPETPRYLIKKNDVTGALKSMSRLRRLPVEHESVIAEVEEIRANHQYELSLGSVGFLDLFKGLTLKRILIGCALQSLQQLTGVNFIFYYGPSFFKNSGMDDPFLIGMITTIVNVCSTFPGIYLVERIGRRNLLLMGALGMAVCQYIVAIVGITADSHTAQIVLIVFVCFYIFFFASSWGPVCWVYTGELYSLKYRANGIAISTAANWLLNFAIGYATPYLVDDNPGSANLGSKVFFVWGSCCWVCVAFVYFFVWETKGLSLEQIDEMFENVGKAWQSVGWVPSHKFSENVEHVERVSDEKAA